MIISQIERDVTLSEKIYDTIKMHIMKNDIAPGSVLNVRELADMFGVSMTPVREALIILEYSGWVRQRGRNKVVVLPSAKELFDYAETRASMELLAFRLTRDRICPEWIEEMRDILKEADQYNRVGDGVNYGFASTKFHLYLCQKSGNQYLYKTLSEVMDHMFRSSVMRCEERFQLRSSIINTHEKLLELLEAKRWDEYEVEIVRHIQKWTTSSSVTVSEDELVKHKNWE